MSKQLILKIMFTKKELVEILVKHLTELCPEFYTQLLEKSMHMNFFEVIQEFKIRGHSFEYIGAGRYIYIN